MKMNLNPPLRTPPAAQKGLLPILRELFRRQPMLIALCYAAFYFPAFFWLEHRPVAHFIAVECAADDLIPFCAAFVIPYVLWFALIPGALLLLARHDRAHYYQLCWVLFVGMTICLFIYLILPNRVFLRQPVTGTDLCSQLVLRLRSADTPTNVCPSIHVSSTVAVMLIAGRCKLLAQRRWAVWAVDILGVLICISTMTLKQHSLVDALCGIVLTLTLDLTMRAWLKYRSRVCSLPRPLRVRRTNHIT